MSEPAKQQQAGTKRREISIRASLLRNMLLVIALLGASILGITLLGANGVAQSLSRTLIGQAIDRTQVEVNHFITPVETSLNLISQWVQTGRIDLASRRGIQDLLIPALEQYEAIYAALIVDPEQETLLLSSLEQGWRARVTNADKRPGRGVYWFPGLQATEAPEVLDYNPAERPWYQGAQSIPAGETYWTDAYRFFESQLPGLTASRRVVDQEGRQWTIGLDVLLEDISEFSRRLDVGYDGLMLLTDGQGQIIGLPDMPQFADPETRAQAYLLRPHQLGFQLATDASNAFLPSLDSSVLTDPVRFESDGLQWWGQGRWIELGFERELWAGVLISEAEILGSIQHLRWLLIGIVALITLLAVTQTIMLARRYSQPIQDLAAQSLRISAGDLRETRPVESSLSEVTKLADAHEKMRVGLTNLLKLEDDLQLARQIQQSTFPDSFPVCKRFEVMAASRPADATGGDTFDVMGIQRHNDQVMVAEQAPEQIYLLLADATGHGVGPALTASQVRAMFRMGVRLGRQINEITCQMNDQLKADVHGGRFVTAWLGHLNSADLTLKTLSAGQAPIIIYRAAKDAFETMGADRPPLGVIASDGSSQLNHIQLASGDVVAVLSDGVLEARAKDGEQFGVDRTFQLIRDHRTQSADAIMQAIKEAVDAFMHEPADDDQTAIIIRCR